MHKNKTTYIKEIVDNIIDLEFPEWEIGSPLYTKNKNKESKKILLAQLLEDIILKNKYLHKNGLPFHYSFSRKEILNKIFRDRTKTDKLGRREIDLNDPDGRTYKETDPRNEEGVKRLFYILYTQSRRLKLTNTYILKPWYRDNFIIGRAIQSITYLDSNGQPQDKPDYALPKNVRDYVGSDISTKIYINIEALGIALREIGKLLEITEDVLFEKREEALGLIRNFLSDELKDGTEINRYEYAIDRLKKHQNLLRAISMYSTSNDYINPFIYQQYTEETSKTGGNGRLWNRYNESGLFDIQTINRVATKIILTDMEYVEYDINNCHINILSQYYKMVFGTNSKELDYFCNNYQKVRHDIVAESGVSYNLVKGAMIGITYGGGDLTLNMIEELYTDTLEEFKIWNKFKAFYITNERAREKLHKLYSSDSFIRFDKAITETTKMLGGQSKKGVSVFGEYYPGYINPALMELENKPKLKDNKKLSHLNQGIEAIALRAIIKDDPDSIVSLHHDGWIGRTKRHRQSNEEITIYLKNLTEKVYRETKKAMIEWNTKIGKPLKEPDGFNFNFSYQRLEGMGNINCKANYQSIKASQNIP
jgi:hypothetical protein